MNKPQAAWMTPVLVLAGFYNLAWGTWAVVAPQSGFRWAGMEPPRYPELWQCIGMIVGVYGIGYLIAAIDPLRHWPIVLVGLLGKVFGPIGFLMAALEGRLPWVAGWVNVTNDLIWWIPFAGILWAAWREFNAENARRQSLNEAAIAETLAQAKTSIGISLAELSHAKPLLLVLLRHSGCTFCREALQDVATHRTEIEQQGLKIVLVHMGGDTSAADMFASYGLGDLQRVADPQCRVYAALGLVRAPLWQVFGPKVWWRGMISYLVKRNAIGPIEGDGFQLPGVAIVHQGKIEKVFRHRSPADRPDYVDLARCHADACQVQH